MQLLPHLVELVTVIGFVAGVCYFLIRVTVKEVVSNAFERIDERYVRKDVFEAELRRLKNGD